MHETGLPEVGVAIDQPALRESVNRALALSNHYSPTRVENVREGRWPAPAYAALVTTLATLRAGNGELARHKSKGCPVVVILSDHERMDDSTAFEAADAFLSAAKVGTLLPAAIVLSAFRLSAIPTHFASAAAFMWK